jgi:hypothetical protein
LRALEAEELVTVAEAASDARVRRATLTPAGADEWDELEQRSEALAESLLEPLSARQRDELVLAMATVERLLSASLVEIEAEDPRSDAARWCLRRYSLELDERFDAGFDPGQRTPTSSPRRRACSSSPASGALRSAAAR